MSTILLDIEADRLLAVEASVSKGRVRALRAFAAGIPDGLRDTDPADFGDWIRVQLNEHGLRGRSAIVAVSRGEVLVKRLDLPVDALDRAERHEMICLQMSRQASMTSDSSVIDYAQFDPEGDRDGFIVASAMPADRVEARTAIVKAAGLRLEGIRLRTAGVRALLGSESDTDRPTLVVNAGIGSVDLLMLVGTEIAFSRSIEATLPESAEQADVYADRIAVEASRTLVSFRLSAAGGNIEHAVIFSGGKLGNALAASIKERLRIPARVLDPSSLIEFDEGIAEIDRSAVASLAGLLLCKDRGIAVHDYANPTAPPDTTAGVRQAVLGGVFLLIILAGAGFLLGQRALASAKDDLAVAKERSQEAENKYVAAQLGGARLGHIKAWTADEIDWPAHMRTIIDTLPGADSVALGQIGVRLDQEAGFKPGSQLADSEAWSATRSMSVTISGVARSRESINQLREKLLKIGVYTVTSQGPEVADRFSLRIVTAAASPPGVQSAESDEASEGEE